MALYLILPKSAKTKAAIVRARNGAAAVTVAGFEAAEISRLAEAGDPGILYRVSAVKAAASAAPVDTAAPSTAQTAAPAGPASTGGPAAGDPAAGDEAWIDVSNMNTPAGYVDEMEPISRKTRRVPLDSGED